MASPKILIVEDEGILAIHLSQKMVQMGYKVCGVAASGEEAIQAALTQKPDVILMDIHLSEAMNGIEAAAQIHQHANIPVIYLTAYADDEFLQQAKVTDAYAYLVKPVRDYELRASLEMTLYKHNTEKQIKHLNQVLLAIREVNRLITHEHDPKKLLQRACEILLNTRGYTFIWVALKEAEGLKLAGWAGINNEVMARAISAASPEQISQLPWNIAIREGRTVVTENLLDHPVYLPWKEFLRDVHCYTVASIPIQYLGETLGVLDVLSEIENVFNPVEVSLLEDMAEDITHGLNALKEEAARKRAEEALRASEIRFRLISENSGDVIWTLDLTSNRFTYVSPSVFRLRGLTPEEVIAEPLEKAMTPESYQRVSEGLPDRIAEFLAGDEDMRVLTDEIDQVHKNGTIIPTEVVTTLILDAENRAVEMVGVSHNTSERKHAEEKMLHLSRQLELILNTAGEGIYGSNLEGKIIFANPAFAAMLGWEDGQLLGQPIHEISHHTRADGSPFPAEECPIYQSTHTGASIKAERTLLWRKDGSSFSAEFNSTPIWEDGAVVIARDISEREAAEAEIHRNVSELEVLYETGLAISQLLDPREVGQKLIDMLEKELNWYHAGVGLYDAATQEMRLLAYSQPGLSTAQKNEQMMRLIKVVSRPEGLSGWVALHGQAVRCPRVNEDPRYLKIDPEIHSGLYIPIRTGDRTIGVISIESESEDAFTQQDERLLTTLASQVAVAIENAQLYRTAQQEIAERKRVEQQLRAAERFAEATIDALSAHVCVLDENGEIISTNSAWRKFGVLNGLSPSYTQTGVNYLAVCDAASGEDSEEASRIARGIRAVMRAETEQYSLEYPCHSPFEERWFQARVTRFPGEGPLRLVISHENVTEVRRVNQMVNIRLRLSEIATTHTLPQLLQHTLDEAEAITFSQSGVIWLIREDQNEPLLQVGSSKAVRTNQANGPAMQNPIEHAVIWEECLRERRTIIHNDFSGQRQAGSVNPNHQPVERVLCVPVIRNNRILSILVVANKPRDYTQQDSQSLEELASASWDITARKQAEESLRASEEQYRGLVESLDNIVAIVNRSGQFLYLNENAARRLDGTPEQILGKKLHDFFPKDDADQQLITITKVVDNNIGMVTVGATAVHGQTRWYRNSFQPIHDEHDQPIFVLLNATDITELKDAQEKLRDLNSSLEERVRERTAEVADLYENAPCGYHSLDANGRCVHINATELDWLGYEFAEVIGRPMTDFMPPSSLAIFKNTFPIFIRDGYLNDIELCHDAKHIVSTREPTANNGCFYKLRVLKSSNAERSQSGRYSLRIDSVASSNTIELVVVDTPLEPLIIEGEHIHEGGQCGLVAMCKSPEDARNSQWFHNGEPLATKSGYALRTII